MMKLKSVAGSVLIGVLAGSMSVHALEIGDAMVDADVKMKNVDGKSIVINDVKGEKGTLVIFTCIHCPFVKGWQDAMVEVGNGYLDKGIGVIFINSNDPNVAGDTYSAMKELAKEAGYKFPFVVDETSDVARNFGATKTPDVFLFDASGTLVYKGAIGEGGQKPKEGGEMWLKSAIDAVIAGESVAKPETKAVGCSIKFR
jgi:peroxiredoxin